MSMAYGAPRPLHWFHVVVLAALVGLSMHALRSRPETRLIGQAKVNAGTTLSARAGEGYRAWDMDLRLDASVRPPGWPWVLHEGKHTGDGYELRWLPEQQSLQVMRTRPEPFLLGSVRLAAQPARVSFRRRGGLFSVLSDEALVLRCLDPDGPQSGGPSAWGCATAGTLGNATLTVQTVELAVPAWGSEPMGEITNQKRTDGPFLAVADALHAPADPEAAAEMFGRARSLLGTVRFLSDQEQPGRALAPVDRVRLRLWLSLARIRWQLATTDAGDRAAFPVVADEIETLFTATDQDPTLTGMRVPELPGILMSLTGPLARRAVTIPASALGDRLEVINERIFDHRRRWLDLLGTVVARSASLARSSLPRADLQQLDLLAHAAGCLRVTDGGGIPEDGQWSGRPLPAPLDAPPWLASRWRAFSGGAPGVTTLPPLPDGAGQVTQALDLLADYVDLDPLSAVELRNFISGRLARREVLMALGQEKETERRDLADEALRACDRPEVPLRERVLSRVLVAIQLGNERPSLLRPVRDVLAASELVHTDPLAFALDQLLVARFGNLVGGESSTVLPDRARIERFFPEYQVLMDGSAAAATRIWRVRLPHAQALAVALIMQEVAGGRPDWALLERVPGFTLPLRLLTPVRSALSTAPGATLAPGSSIAP